MSARSLQRLRVERPSSPTIQPFKKQDLLHSFRLQGAGSGESGSGPSPLTALPLPRLEPSARRATSPQPRALPAGTVGSGVWPVARPAGGATRRARGPVWSLESGVWRSDARGVRVFWQYRGCLSQGCPPSPGSALVRTSCRLRLGLAPAAPPLFVYVSASGGQKCDLSLDVRELGNESARSHLVFSQESLTPFWQRRSHEIENCHVIAPKIRL